MQKIDYYGNVASSHGRKVSGCSTKGITPTQINNDDNVGGVEYQ